jgi:hypothetical protein
MSYTGFWTLLHRHGLFSTGQSTDTIGVTMQSMQQRTGTSSAAATTLHCRSARIKEHTRIA